jgi:hypothetical protein
MLPKNTPETLVAIQVKLAYLRNRKRVLNDLIACLERYSVHEVPLRRGPARSSCAKTRVAA